MCEAKPEAEVTTAVDSVLQILTDTTFSLAAELGTFDGQFQRFISEKAMAPKNSLWNRRLARS